MKLIFKTESVRGGEKTVPHYEQLLQNLNLFRKQNDKKASEWMDLHIKKKKEELFTEWK